MGSLTEQLKELLSMLEVIDPDAAKEFRGFGQAKPVFQYRGPQADAQPVTQLETELVPDKVESQPAPVQPARIPAMEKKAAKPVVPIQPAAANLLQLSLNSDSLVQGIIMSEVLGPPVSKRRNQHRPR